MLDSLNCRQPYIRKLDSPSKFQQDMYVGFRVGGVGVGEGLGVLD